MKLYKYYSLATKDQMGYAAQAIVLRELYCGDPATLTLLPQRQQQKCTPWRSARKTGFRQ